MKCRLLLKFPADDADQGVIIFQKINNADCCLKTHNEDLGLPMKFPLEENQIIPAPVLG